MSEANPWRETVRDLYDALILGTYGRNDTANLLALIDKRHAGYFEGPEAMTAPTRNARVTDRNERSEHLRNLADDEAEEEALANASAFIADLRRALATMTADRDRWRAQAEHSWPGKGSP